MRVSDGCFFVFLIPFLLFGFLFAEDSLARGLKSRRMEKEWIPVPAKVISKSVLEIPSSPSSDSKNSTYRPAVVYEYQVLQKTYRSDHVDCLWQSSSGDPADSEEVLARYLPGQSMTAYLNPEDPGDAVLETSARISWPSLFAGIGFGSLSLLFGFAFTAAMKNRFRFRPLRGGATEARPLFGMSLIPPGLLLLVWAAYAAIGFACVGIAASVSRPVWIILLAHAAIGLGFLAWLLRIAIQRHRFSGIRLSYGTGKIVPGTPITWSLKGPTQQLRSPRCSLVYRESSYTTSSHGFEQSGTWTDVDRRSRPLRPGTFTIGKDEPKPMTTGNYWAQWAIKVEDGPVTAYFPLPEMEG